MVDLEKRKKLHKILDLVMDINGFEGKLQPSAKGSPTAFFYFQGHVEACDISVHKNGWDAGMMPDKDMKVYLDWNYASENLDKIINELEKFQKEFLSAPESQEKQEQIRNTDLSMDTNKVEGK